LRIDHLLLNAELAPRLVAADVDKAVRGEIGASDHAPVWIEIGAGTKRRAARTPSQRRVPADAENDRLSSTTTAWAGF